MHEKQTSTYEHSDTTEAYEALLAHEPKFISVFVPTNAAEQKAAFLRGDVINPMHEYGKLDAIDFADEALGIEVAGQELLTSSGVADKQRGVYEEFVRGYAHKL